MGLGGDKEGSGLDENIRIQKGGRVITRMQGFKKNNTISEKELIQMQSNVSVLQYLQ